MRRQFSRRPLSERVERLRDVVNMAIEEKANLISELKVLQAEHMTPDEYRYLVNKRTELREHKKRLQRRLYEPGMSGMNDYREPRQQYDSLRREVAVLSESVGNLEKIRKQQINYKGILKELHTKRESLNKAIEQRQKYAEDMMRKTGFGDLAVRLAKLLATSRDGVRYIAESDEMVYKLHDHVGTLKIRINFEKMKIAEQHSMVAKQMEELQQRTIQCKSRTAICDERRGRLVDFHKRCLDIMKASARLCEAIDKNLPAPNSRQKSSTRSRSGSRSRSFSDQSQLVAINKTL